MYMYMYHVVRYSELCGAWSFVCPFIVVGVCFSACTAVKLDMQCYCIPINYALIHVYYVAASSF